MLLLHLKTLLGQLLLLPAAPLLLAAAGWLLLRRWPLLARTLIAVGILAVWVFSTPVVGEAMTRLAQRTPVLDVEHLDGAQAIVILGGGGQRAWAPEYAAPAAGPELLEKLAYGAYLSRRTGLPILVTGYGIEATAMRSTLQQNFDITPRWVDDQAYDTFQNAHNSAALLEHDGIQRVIVLTRATHMLRSMREFAATGLAVIPAPVGTLLPGIGSSGLREYLPDGAGLLLSYEAVYEIIGEPVRWALNASHLRRQQSAR